MKRVNVLDLETSNKIAAGEVVERPFSVVKELVENSIDSGAKNITVETIDGGQKSIKVLDDGDGIHADDIEKVFMPHATSKIKNIEDVYSINTMGFRGEALASIASVSNTVLRSRAEEFDFGKEISISGGNINYIKDAACNLGTTIEVNDLFFNVPARKKFLKSSSRESAYITDILNRLSLAHSDVSFKLINNGKKVLTTYGTGNLLDAIRCVYGKTICDNVLTFERHTDIMSIYGYIGNSEISRGSRNNESIFVNKRYIKNKLITAAVENAFKSFLMINKYPFFVLFLDIFPEYIDVNVHPTKSEIKFRDDREIFKIIFDTVHAALRDSIKDSFNIPVEEINNDLPDIGDKNKGEDSLTKDGLGKIENKKDLIQLPIDLNSKWQHNYESPKPAQDKSYIKNQIQEYNSKDFQLCKENNELLKIDSNCKNENDEKNIEMEAKFPKLNVIGQFHNTYILAQYGDTLYLIDQHAAHEKILFEKYKNSIKENDVIAQILITPVIIELYHEDFLYYTDNKEIFSKAGFNIEIFGDNTISIREVPLILGKPDVKNLFMDILENLKNMGSGETWTIKYNAIAKLACKAAIKANDNLSNIEMDALVEDLRFIEDPFNCPHGRPTIIKFTLNELEKKFKRIQ
ncbi:DNA mismatch repair protein MutL [Clostridium carboxidivorans P7]|uniref:DNA mismatch repair protein MutL n=1 Tax=Clostridium carboxidivorans P7 TaxID=536227 RepID=C6PTQ2_9CLOT|nr:DNA mismatch repair endonuclease MutL [Clostridium carboxidivorans]AKN30675.1 DNA mismatch repair protein MutL [Clostridium carboxidivorans P7]EET87388.1 DNA mismatch repair protein MutL [Clostridium carboxidivorans P7]EFG86101.1 DNA mismatch repair protein [Clostridium carboxidivorans P7]